MCLLNPRFKNFAFLPETEDKDFAQETFKRHALQFLEGAEQSKTEAAEPPAKKMKPDRGVFAILCGKHVVDSCDKAQKEKSLPERLTAEMARYQAEPECNIEMNTLLW